MRHPAQGQVMLMALFMMAMLGVLSSLMHRIASSEWQRAAGFATEQALLDYAEKNLLEYCKVMQKGTWEFWPACGEKAGWYAAGCPLPDEQWDVWDQLTSEVIAESPGDEAFTPLWVKVLDSGIQHADGRRHVTVIAHAEAMRSSVALTLEAGVWTCPGELSRADVLPCDPAFPLSWRVSP